MGKKSQQKIELNSDELTRKRMRAVRTKGTSLEEAFASELQDRGISYNTNTIWLAGSPDFYVPALNLVIFVHGCFWHRHLCRKGRLLPQRNRDFWKTKLEKNSERDASVESVLLGQGFEVLLLWECQLSLAHMLADHIRATLDDAEMVPND